MSASPTPVASLGGVGVDLVTPLPQLAVKILTSSAWVRLIKGALNTQQAVLYMYSQWLLILWVKFRGATKFGVTRCGNWWRHSFFTSKSDDPFSSSSKLMTFLVVVATPTLSASACPGNRLSSVLVNLAAQKYLHFH